MLCCVITAPSRPTHSRPTQNVSHGIAETRLEPCSTRTQCGCGSAPGPGSTAGPRFHRNRVEVLELGVGTRCTMCRASLSAASPDKQRVPLRPPLRCLSTICRFNRTTIQRSSGRAEPSSIYLHTPQTSPELLIFILKSVGQSLFTFPYRMFVTHTRAARSCSV